MTKMKITLTDATDKTKKMKPYLIIAAEALFVAAVASLIPLSFCAYGEIFLAQIFAHVFGAAVAWFFIVMVRIEYKFQH